MGVFSFEQDFVSKFEIPFLNYTTVCFQKHYTFHQLKGEVIKREREGFRRGGGTLVTVVLACCGFDGISPLWQRHFQIYFFKLQKVVLGGHYLTLLDLSFNNFCLNFSSLQTKLAIRSFYTPCIFIRVLLFTELRGANEAALECFFVDCF